MRTFLIVVACPCETSNSLATGDRVGRNRVAGLPPVEREGNYEDLPLEDGEGLAEISHFVYLPKANVLGLESGRMRCGHFRMP
jgi:hypothetical protein